MLYTAISIKVVHEQSGKVEYERERLLGIANKSMNFQKYQDFQCDFYNKKTTNEIITDIRGMGGGGVKDDGLVGYLCNMAYVFFQLS
jgi:hypothetical protein